jgi:hypothetical protein
LESIDQFNGLTEVAGFHGHDHVDWIEVLVTSEASGEIGFGVGCGLELGTQGTQKTEASF